MLLLGNVTAQADTCKGCTWQWSGAGNYLGDYWPGDRGTFNSRTPAGVPPGYAVNNFWVIDLNANGTLDFTASTRAAPFENFRAELYVSGASYCDPIPGGACSQVGFYPLIGCTHIAPGDTECQQVTFTQDLASPDGVRPWTLKVPVVAGRYVLRILGRKDATGGESAYSGKVTLRK